RQPRSRARSQDGVGARQPRVLSARGDARSLRGAAARAGCGPDHGARAGRVAADDDAARPGGSPRRGRGRGARGLLLDAARPSAGAVTVRPPAALSISVIVPSPAPSGARAVSPPPTLSRTLPL